MEMSVLFWTDGLCVFDPSFACFYISWNM